MSGPRGKAMHLNRGRKPKDAGKTIKRIFSYMKGYRGHLAAVFLLVLISSAGQIAATYFLKPLFNDFILPFVGMQNPDLSAFIRMLVIMALIYASGALATFIYNRLMITVATGTLYKIRTELFSHMQKLPIRYFDTHTHGELMSRYTNDTDALRNMLSQSLVNIFSSLVTVTGVFIAMCILSPVLTVVVVLMLLLMLFIIKKLGGKSGKFFMQQQASVGKVNGYIEEMTEGQKVVKVFCHEDQSKKEFDKLNEELFEAAKGANTFASMLRPIMGNLSYMHYSITAIVGALLAITRGLDLGSLASFLQYTRSFSQPITMMSEQFNAILMALAGAERIFEMMDEKPEHDEGTVTLVYVQKDKYGDFVEVEHRTGLWAWKQINENGKVTYTQVKGDIRLNDVVFGYEENKTVLSGISLYAKPGQKIAFVGSTGAGKTTITNLLNRFYDVPDGSILYDGIPINRIKKADLRRSLSMVLQDTHLFTGTVMENIRYGRLDASDEEVIAAAKLANADSFIQHLPQGYDTLLTSDGTNLSQGQRQLLAIARAAVAEPPVLILDEATSSIDTRTEALIEKGMDKLMEGRTVFVIAHRLSTVRNSNAIMVLENGTIIERGDHDDLIEQAGKYYQLYTGMFELS
ncbi:MAG: ABC transporter ATP-binding protein [Clostridiaceae bacterium]|jgi:ATP-binding cassette subfamily B protein|nr:ABC transporter ATP-binding protein [Clostridiaceae bacterium]